ncbi:phospholipase [Rhodocytophaga rosea]|uniref:Phospholipase n=1 Tax=Rhodocytophaga rosea TaxID=2704465 RepID=A0A6C0GTW8_9BACT|nr:dienelactone hydrolase family protein [Rhodocytophaga rosea]QHT71628.1 phospholipase [Rhodocytophaga rosea]
MHKKQIIQAGKDIKDAKKVLIMLHGRGASAEDILSIASYLKVNDFAILAPQATNYTWYPYSFLMPPKQNEPWLSSAIEVLKEIVKDINEQGISSAHIYFLGFSQGACLTLEFVARHATRWGGAVAFTGGLIGDKIYPENYSGDFNDTPVFIGTSDPDPHVPVERVEESVQVLERMHAQVTKKVYKNMGHTISQDEIDQVNKLIFKD